MASAAWERRNARARQLGYESYYDYRVHNHGRTPPSAPRASGEQLSRLRGHRGAADLERDVNAGRVAFVAPLVAQRDRKGRVTQVDMRVTYADGTMRTFRVKGAALQPARTRRLRDALDDAGVDYRPGYVLSAVWARAA